MSDPNIALAHFSSKPSVPDNDDGGEQKQHELLLKSRLSQVELLETLPREDLEWLSHRTPDVFLDQGQIFYMPGHTAKAVYLLLEGQMRLYQVLEGRELTTELIEAGSTFGEPALAGEPQGMYAQTLRPSQVGLLGLRVLEQLVHRYPEVGLKAMQLLSKQVLSYRSKMVDLALKDVLGRLASLILSLIESEGVMLSGGNYRIPTRYTHEQLGSMVGAKRVAVTRAFGKLQQAGIVQLKRRYIYIYDLASLEDFAAAA